MDPPALFVNITQTQHTFGRTLCASAGQNTCGEAGGRFFGSWAYIRVCMQGPTQFGHMYLFVFKVTKWTCICL